MHAPSFKPTVHELPLNENCLSKQAEEAYRWAEVAATQSRL